MRVWWNNLSERERLILAVGGSIFALVILVQFIIMPIFNWRADQHDRLSEAEGLYELVAEAAPRARRTAEGAVDASTPIQNAVSQSARVAGVELVYRNARPDGRVDTNVASADPEALYAWLQNAHMEYGVVVQLADISRETGNPAAVRAQLTLSRQP